MNLAARATRVRHLSLLAAVALPGLACQETHTPSGSEAAFETRTSALSWDHVTARITASDATIVPRTTVDKDTWHATLMEDGREHYVVEMAGTEVGAFHGNGRHAPLNTLLVKNDPDCDGGTCVKFNAFGARYGDYAPPNVNDRVEVEVLSGEQEGAMVMNQWRYLRFFMMLSPATEDLPSGNQILISQAWQVHGGRPRAPVFEVRLAGNRAQGFELRFVYHNDEVSGTDSKGNPVYKAQEITTTSPVVVTPGVWASFHIAMKPVARPAGPPGGNPQQGYIRIWRDKGLAFVPGADPTLINPNNQSFYWGYRPLNTDATGTRCLEGFTDCVKSTISQRLGVYRNDALASSAFVSFKMDDIKITTDESFMPGY